MIPSQKAQEIAGDIMSRDFGDGYSFAKFLVETTDRNQHMQSSNQSLAYGNTQHISHANELLAALKKITTGSDINNIDQAAIRESLATHAGEIKYLRNPAASHYPKGKPPKEVIDGVEKEIPELLTELAGELKLVIAPYRERR